MAVTKGLDGLIINSLDKAIMVSIIVAETLAGKDEFCTKYLKSYRKKKLEL
jgi:hypothetical protein